MPRKVSEIDPAPLVVWGPRAMREAPSPAAFVAEVIALWADIDVLLSQLVTVHLVRTDHRIVADLVSRSGSANVRRKLIKAMVNERPELPDREAILGVLDMIPDISGWRHEFAHGLWGYVSGEPDKLAWRPWKDSPTEIAAHLDRIKDGGWLSANPPRLSEPVIYTTHDLVKVRDEVERVWSCFDVLNSSSSEGYGWLYLQLEERHEGRSQDQSKSDE